MDHDEDLIDGSKERRFTVAWPTGMLLLVGAAFLSSTVAIAACTIIGGTLIGYAAYTALKPDHPYIPKQHKTRPEDDDQPHGTPQPAIILHVDAPDSVRLWRERFEQEADLAKRQR